MTQWIDLSGHDMALLVRKNSANQNELVLRRLRPEADVPDEAIAYGFEREGEIFVRRETKFNLQEMRRLYPRAAVADMALEDIVYRVAADVAVLPPPASPAPQATSAEPAANAETAGEAETFTSNQWAHVPLPRFRSEARITHGDGLLWVEHSGLRYPVESRRNEDASKDHVHRMTVENALKLGERLPFAVLVDYPDLAYFGARKSHASTRVGKLLSQLGIAERLMQGDTGYARLVNDPYMDLVIERLPYPDGDRLVLTHYRKQNGDLILDAEMVFAIRDGRLFLKETAVENTLRGGELRGYDHYFANVFSKNLIEQGFGQSQVIWPFDRQPAPERTEAVEPEISDAKAQFIPIGHGPNAGMTMALVLDHAGAATLAVGMSRAAANAALEDQAVAAASGLPRQLGENLLGHTIWEDDLGRRQLRFGETVLQEADGDRGLEFLTMTEAKRAGQLSLVMGTPVGGATLFGKPIFRSLDDRHYAIERRSGGEIFGFRLHAETGATPEWISLGEPWTHGAPSDGELRSATSQRRDSEFDQSRFIDQVNELIAESNVGLEDRLQLQPLNADDLVIAQPDKASYEVRLAQWELPIAPVKIVADGEFWRASRDSAQSLRAPLESAFAWANKELANSRMHYLSNLHRAVDGSLHIGLPQAEFALIRSMLHKVSIREQVQWKDLGLSHLPETPIALFQARAINDQRTVVSIKGTQLIYELFALELDPVSTMKAYEQQGLHRLGGWLRQVDRDVAWEATLQTHPSGSLLAERLREYQDYQIKHFGERFAARVPSDHAREVVLAITDRNLNRLLDSLARNASNVPSTAKLFQDVSGMSLGTNRASREAAIYAYCGYSPEAAADHSAQQAALRRVKLLEADAKRTIERCERFHISHEGSVINGRQFVEKLFAAGFSQLHTTKRGAATRYGLMNPTTRSYYDIKEPLTSYVRHLLAIRDSAQSMPAPELDDKPVPVL